MHFDYGEYWNILDIGACVEKHKTIIPDLSGGHALTGCDIVSQCFSIVKKTTVKALNAGNRFQTPGKID